MGQPRLVVLRALGLGDLLTALPALRALADALAGHELVLCTPAELAPLAVHAGVTRHVLDTRSLAQALDGDLGPVDVAVNLHGRGPQSHRLLGALRPTRLIAFANRQAGVDGPVWRSDEHEVHRWCRLLRESDVAADHRRLGLEPVAPSGAAVAWVDATVVHPGAGSPARRWPAERWAAAARAEVGRGRDVVVTGGPTEAELAMRVATLAGLPGHAVQAGTLDILELAALVGVAGRVVCGDTGVAHLATALGTPSVVLFGPTPPDQWGPPPGQVQHRVLWAGGIGDPHGREVDPSLLDISVDDVSCALVGLDGVSGRDRPPT